MPTNEQLKQAFIACVNELSALKEEEHNTKTALSKALISQEQAEIIFKNISATRNTIFDKYIAELADTVEK